MLRHPNTPARHGVILLIVLAVLAMFLLLALTFVLVAAHYYSSARSAARAQERVESPQELLDEAFHQVVRGTQNTASVLRTHSLLEDIYGQAPSSWSIGVPGVNDDGDKDALGNDIIDETDGSESVIPADFSPICNGQLYELTLPDPVRENGCVMTMLDGPAAGQSTRIVGTNPSTGKAQILAFQGATPVAGNHYTVNGVPFSGTGFGFNTASGTLNGTFTLSSTYAPVALVPNPAALRDPTSGNYADPAADGGANEDYDAVDYQNMLLAMEMPAGSVPIPSLHRAELAQYWTSVISMSSGMSVTFGSLPIDLKHAIVLRPLRDFHVRFDGGNPTFDPTWDGVSSSSNLRWDVDNDGDGQYDSVWVDLGLPVRSTPDGRLYKPLFAILCTDLDGRFNVNAHGCLAQTEGNYYNPVVPSDPYFAPPITGSFAFGATFGGMDVYLPRGLGWGPAEINLRRLFSDLPAYQTFLEARYGADALPGTNGDDFLSQNIWTEYGGAYWTLSSPDSSGAYGSPPSAKGKAAIALSTTGHPLYCAMGVDEQTDDPYELRLNERTAADSPFTAAELERILRPYDADVSTVPDRLAKLISAAGYRSMTTESWDVPCPGLGVPRELRDSLSDKRLHHLTDLLAARGIAPAVYRYLWPPEMLAGLRMDLNRPFGNGADDNANNVVDEPARILYTGGTYQLAPNLTGEILVSGNREQAVQFDSEGNAVTNIDFSHVNGIDVNQDGVVNDVDEAMGRQLYARNLYVLTLLLINYRSVPVASLTPDERDRARVVAQWAVNVVDFRDRDSIMTPFEFDLSPFVDENGDSNPWDVDGVVGLETSPSPDDDESTHPYRRLVWGCERPELVISETLALHDRRTEDLDTDSDKNKKTTDPSDPDDDFDQRFKPEGSLFVEFYNPNTAMEPLPAELCSGTDGTSTGGAGVDLTKVATDGTATSPVWRVVIVRQENGALNPDDPNNPVPIERSVYFVDTSAATLPADNADIQFHPDATRQSEIQPIMPGRYAMIGPGGSTGTSTTYLGYRTDGTHGSNTTRRIELNPSTGQVAVYSDGATDDLTTVTIMPAVPVIINQPQRLSITEPKGGYTDVGYDASAGYAIPFDQPLDAAPVINPSMWDAPYVKLKNNGIFPKVRVIHLQRLANPMQPYDAHANPYLTVDTMAVDVNSFNGVTSERDNQPASIVQESGTLDDIRTRQRGETTVSAYGNTNNVWTQEPITGLTQPTNDGPGVTATNHYLNSPFHHTLGYLNFAFGAPQASPAGDPPTPFPWLTWPNRPLISHFELPLVPAASSRQLLMNSADINLTDNPMAMTFNYGTSVATAAPYTNAKQPFGHLWNFFFSQELGVAAPASGPPTNLARLLDFVQVPSRFVGTSLQGNPLVFVNPALGTHWFVPPFQHIPLYREPGRVNLNTIFDPTVWEGLMNFFPDMETDTTNRPVPMFWSEFVASRRGYDTSSDQTLLSQLYPTRFAIPFRTPGGASLVPNTWDATSSFPDNDLQRTVSREVNSTILRAEVPSAAYPPLPANPARPLLQFDSTSAATIAARVGGQPIISDLNQPNRNAAFADQVFQRLGNLATTRSNAYAIWITVGYFEVEPIKEADAPTNTVPGLYSAVYPDGCQLGKELGTDTGEIKRHRAFYIFDRSIPVGFQRGQNLNVDKAVLLKRFIE